MKDLTYIECELMGPDRRVGDALDFFQANRNLIILPVGQNKKVLGTCSFFNLLKSSHEEILENIVSRDVACLRDYMNIYEAYDFFAESTLSQALVLNGAEEFRGIVRREDIINTLLIDYRNTIEFAHEGIIGCDSSGRMQVINAAAERILGISKEHLGKELLAVSPLSRIHEAMDNKKAILNVERYYPATDITALVNYQPILDATGRVKGGAITLREITEIKKLTRELYRMTETKNYMDAVLNNINEGVVEIDTDSTILYANPAYERVLGISSSKVLGRKLSQIEPDANILQVLKTGQKITSGVTHVKTVATDVVFEAFPIRSGDNITGAIAIFRRTDDITHLYEQLQILSCRNKELEKKLSERESFPISFKNIIGRSGRFREALALAAKASVYNTTVLIRGESGTGKEVLAKAIHEASSRRDRPLVRVNCAAIPENLLESELFGYEPGAFTGASKSGKLGKFDLAQNGTIFLDEIGDLSLSTQAKLLRVLQEREFERLGGTKTIKCDIRIMAATNRDLEDLISKKLFREDLYYRINVVTIYLPPLRDRKDDILPLTTFFLKKHQGNREVNLSREAYRTILSYPWYGNARELENVIEHALVVTDSDIIEEKDLPSYILSAVASNHQFYKGPDTGPISYRLKKIEREAILSALKEANYNKSKAMAKLGMSRKLFYRRLKDYDIPLNTGSRNNN